MYLLKKTPLEGERLSKTKMLGQGTLDQVDDVFRSHCADFVGSALPRANLPKAGQLDIAPRLDGLVKFRCRKYAYTLDPKMAKN